MIDTCVTPKNKPFKPSHTFVYTIATMSAECVIRFSNFKIRGTFHSSVLLFTSSDNKDIVGLTNGVHADKVTLCVVKLVKGNFTNKARSICKKCARKRFKHSNCCVQMYSKGLTTSTLAWLLSYAICSSRLISEKISGRYHVNNMQ